MGSDERGRFFLSYRREDSAGHAGRLADHLLGRFGSGSVFMDVESIQAGVDFAAEIGRAIAECDAVLVVIGPGWIDARGPGGARRLEDPADFVRGEVTAALESQVRVIPVLVSGASMPTADELPRPIAGLARLNAIEIQDRRWREDMEGLEDLLERRVSVCPRCGRENPQDAAFCMGCGSALQVAAPPRELRKTVTMVVAGVMSSTAPGDELDPEALRNVMSRYFDAMREALGRHGGTVKKLIGDEVMAVFGIPQVHEDDALRAVRAAADMREAIERLGKELERDQRLGFAVRIGVNTGEVVAGDSSSGEALVTGDPVKVAASLEQAASPGEVLIGEDTYRLVRDSVDAERIEPLSLKGTSEAVSARRLLRVTDALAGRPRRMDSPMIGRRRELDSLRSAFERAASDRACQLFTVLAPAGTGKSRLIEEFIAGLGESAVLVGRCLPYGEGITYFPILEIVKQAAGLADFDAPEVIEEKVCRVLEGEEHQEVVCGRVAQLLGVAEGGSAEETFWAVRRFIEAVARHRSLVVVLDDIHWAEPTLLDLVEHVAEWSRDVPILLACMARPELLDLRPAWGGGKLNASTISLETLSDAECEELISNLLGAAEVPAEVSSRIVAAAEGNPLFVEEMLAMLVDDGLLSPEDGRSVPATDLSEVAVPATITALLAARLDRLSSDERGVLEAASVLGKEFFLGAVRELAPHELRPGVPALLMALVRKELVRPDRSTLPDEDAFRFRHLLIRDATYDAMPKQLRADLHERAADWLVRVAGDRVAEQEEIVGHHLEQAYHYRMELNPNDTSASTLAERAGLALAAAGRRAYARGDMRASANLLVRASTLLPSQRLERLELLPDLSDALAESGEQERAMQLLDEAMHIVDQVGDARIRAHLVLARRAITQEPSGEGWEQAAEREARDALQVFEETGDEAGQADAWRTLGFVEWGRGRIDAAISSWQRAAAYAGRAGDRAGEAHDRAWLLIAYGFGSVPVEETLSRALDTLALVEDVPAAKAEVLWEVAGNNAMLGNFDAAHAAMESSKQIERDLGRGLTASHYGAQVEEMNYRLEGDREARARVLRQGLDAYQQVANELNPMLAALLAEALADLGQYEEAWQLAEAAREASHGFLHVMPHVLGAEGIVLAHRGLFEEAEQGASKAIEMLRATEFVWSGADSLIILGEVQRLAGKRAEAEASIREALAIYENKGIVPLADQARSRLAQL
jgi:class 3 adenylate cyclase/tetratricopeptide (TPR) repeat protein